MTQTAEAPAYDVKARAQRYYAEALDRGDDPSARELAGKFGHTDRWARGIRAEVNAEREAKAAERAAAETRAAELATEQAARRARAPEPTGEAVTSIQAPPVVAEAVAEARPEIALVPPTEVPQTPKPALVGHGPGGFLHSLAQNGPQNATTADLRPSGHPEGPAATEPHTVEPSALVQIQAAAPTTEARPEPRLQTGTAPGTLAVPVPAPTTPAERAPETRATSGTVERNADTDAETHAEQSTAPAVPGRAVAWTAFATGILASVAANVLHAADGGAAAPELIGAAFWPVALLLAVELLTRVAWPAGFWFGFGRYVGVSLVGLVAAVLSYRHMVGLLQMWGEDPLNAHLGPLAVDGLMLVAATALLAITHSRKTTN